MRILHIIGTYKPAFVYGGPMFSVSALAETQTLLKHDVTVFTTNSNANKNLNVPTNTVVDVEGVKVIYFNRIARFTEFSFSLIKYLLKHSKEYDIVHIHSWWSLNILCCSWILFLKQQKFIISPRGMLSPYSFQNKASIIKKIIFNLISKPLLVNSYLHATSRIEENDLRLLLKKKDRLFNIPNIIAFPRISESSILINNSDKKQINLLFLSRIDKVKGIEYIIKALPLLVKEGIGVTLKIAGSGDDNYINELKRIAQLHSVTENIEWIGFVSGESKEKLFRESDVVLLPSKTENFANIILESLFFGKPVIVSKRVGLSDYVEENNFGFVINTSSQDIVSVCLAFLEQKHIWRQKSPEMHLKVCCDFNKNAIVESYIGAYTSILN